MPVYGFGRRYLYLTGLYAAIAGLAQVYGRTNVAHPQVTVNALESVVSLLPYASLQFAYNGTTETIEHSGPRFMCRCQDGHIVIYSGGAWPAQAAMLGQTTSSVTNGSLQQRTDSRMRMNLPGCSTSGARSARWLRPWRLRG